jgi:hypothetical protein
MDEVLVKAHAIGTCMPETYVRAHRILESGAVMDKLIMKP